MLKKKNQKLIRGVNSLLDTIECSTPFGFNSFWSTSRAATSIIVFRFHLEVDFFGQFLKHFCATDFWEVHLSILPK